MYEEISYIRLMFDAWEKKEGLSKSLAAKKLGISTIHYSRVKGGEMIPSVKLSKKIYLVVKIEPRILLFPVIKNEKL